MADHVKEVQRLEKKLARYDTIIKRCRFTKLKNYYRNQRWKLWDKYCDLTKQPII